MAGIFLHSSPLTLTAVGSRSRCCRLCPWNRCSTGTPRLLLIFSHLTPSGQRYTLYPATSFAVEGSHLSRTWLVAGLMTICTRPRKRVPRSPSPRPGVLALVERQ
jgi:hypothetical protein